MSFSALTGGSHIDENFFADTDLTSPHPAQLVIQGDIQFSDIVLQTLVIFLALTWKTIFIPLMCRAFRS